MQNVTLIRKIILSLLSGFVVFETFNATTQHHWPKWIPSGLFLGLATACFILPILFIPIWQYLEKKNKTNSLMIASIYGGVISYSVAFTLCWFGLQKLLGLHMVPSQIINDLPAGSLSGYHLMDYFFGRAPGFKMLIGTLQIIGSLLLLFGRTRLIGAFILLPLVLNIVLMDLFYDIGGGITFAAVSLLFGLSYIIIESKEFLITFFRTAGERSKFFNSKIKYLIRVSAIIIPVIVLLPNYKSHKNQRLQGKYQVTALTIGNKKTTSNHKKNSLSTVYFDDNNDCVFRFTDYSVLLIGKSYYNTKSQILKVIWRYPKNQRDTLICTVSKSKYQPNEEILDGMYGKSRIQLSLLNVPYPAVTIK